MIFLGIYFLARNIFLYTMCFFRSPGGVKEYRKCGINFEKRRERELKDMAGLNESEKNALKFLISDYKTLERELTLEKSPSNYCTICDAIKPLRTHHCYTCGRCSMRMDHHCVWLHNCISLENYRYFLQLIFHSALSSYYTLICIFEISYYPFYVSNILSIIIEY
jgi:hypothetical protein